MKRCVCACVHVYICVCVCVSASVFTMFPIVTFFIMDIASTLSDPVSFIALQLLH